MPIRMLDAATIGRIAAGEVVERPLSVIKELVENSLDAGASAITIEIRDGGGSYLRVTDNGIGIPPGEVELAFQNHATSKIDDSSDLLHINTLGFRGEALPSIASVSRVEMTSCQRTADHGMRIRINAGVTESLEECAAPAGTSVVVRDLFYNVPARRAFLRRKTTEIAIITELVMKFMVGNPYVAFRFISSERTLHQTFGDGKMISAALNVFGRNIAGKLVEIDEQEGDIKLRGWVGLGDCARPTRSMQALFVNGRLVRCQQISNALDEATKGRVMVGTHPICAVHVSMPPDSVDANVHPSKLEIRIRDEAALTDVMSAMFARGLHAEGMLNLDELNKSIPEIQAKPTIAYSKTEAKVFQEVDIDMSRLRRNRLPKFPTRTTADDSEQTPPAGSRSRTDYDPRRHLADQKISKLRYGIDLPPREHALHEALDVDWQSEQTQFQIPVQPDHSSVSPQPKPGGDKPFTVIGVAFMTYVIVEYDGMLLLIDQHAAHERLLFERYMKTLDTQTVSQQLLTPVIVELLSTEMALLIEHRQILEDVGYSIEPFGDRAIQLRAVPQVLGKTDDMGALILSMVGELERLRNTLRDRKRMSIITFACKRAVKAGDKLNDAEIRSLLTDMMDSGAPPTCPHGRPVLHKMTKWDLERFFKRK